jgi:hypothetical protein
MDTSSEGDVLAAEMTWQTMLDRAAKRGMLGKQLYVVRSNPTNGMGPIVDNLERHVQHQMRLEAEGVMFAAGPLASEDGQQWLRCTSPAPATFTCARGC